MGLGDYIHYTAIIRDLYNFINEPNDINKKIDNINKIRKSKNICDIGIINYVSNDNNMPFKFLLKCSHKYKPIEINFMSHHQSSVIFSNNPYVTNDEKYKNIIYFRMISCFYWSSHNKNGVYKVIDNIHIVHTYAKILNLKKYNKLGELYINNKSQEKINKLLPSKKFILIESTFDILLQINLYSLTNSE